jgi:hypoxanthine-guanine phosphoribosyltransferase
MDNRLRGKIKASIIRVKDLEDQIEAARLDRNLLIREAIDSGDTMYSIAKEFKMSKPAVKAICEKTK